MNNFEVEILSPQGLVFGEEIFSASFPTTSGVITVLPGHAGLVTKLKNGEILLDTQNGTKKIAITGGFAEITGKSINVIAEFAVHSDEANKQKIEQAMQLAKEMKIKRKDFVDMSVIETELKKSVAGLKSELGIKRR
jgi:F-type H+-transporting ATPase subunit epsilon